ncbi:phosphatase PAP2 family protein [Thomasclavelia cocleata]|nr:phosphatase PAP2 family protein [Thomasclavelia cocleata]
MAFSRLYLFVHYLSDVTFGIILGISVGIIVMMF